MQTTFDGQVAQVEPEFFEQILRGRKTKEFRDRPHGDATIDAIRAGTPIVLRCIGKRTYRAVLVEATRRPLRNERTGRYTIPFAVIREISCEGRKLQGWRRRTGTWDGSTRLVLD